MVELALYLITPLIIIWLIYSLVTLLQNASSDEELNQLTINAGIAAVLGAVWLWLGYAYWGIPLSYDIFRVFYPLGILTWMIQIIRVRFK